jgi:hypothetical protein
LRNLYSASEKKKPYLSLSNALSNINKTSELASAKENPESTTNTTEVKEILLKNIKQFKDLIGIYQRKNHLENPIIPMGEFKTVLRGLGISLPH